MEMLWSILYVIILGIVSHFWGVALPRERFHEDQFPWCPYAWENGGNIYRHVGVHKWRTKVPDMSRYLSDMVPKRFSTHMTPEDVEILIKETCVAEYVHFWLCIAFLGELLIWRSLTGVWLWLVYTVCNMPYIIIQRYNRPMLCRVRDRLLLRNARIAAKSGAMPCAAEKTEAKL